MYIPKVIKIIFDFNFFKKIFAIGILFLIAYLLRDFLIFFLLIFLFSYLFGHLGDVIETKIDNFLLKFDNKTAEKLARFISFKLVITLLYIIFISFLILAISNLIPELLQELRNINNQFPVVSNQIQEIVQQLEQIKNINSDISGTLSNIVNEQNYQILLKFLENLRTFGGFILQFILSIIISYIIIIDKRHSLRFLKAMKNSNFEFFYKEYKNLFGKIKLGFGLIFKAQALIAIVNTIITALAYYSIGLLFGGFPYTLTMAIVVFVCSFIPILGMWLSAIPLCLLAFTVGGFKASVFVFLAVVFVHLLEAYVLNPKIVSSYLELPISITFIVLIVSEHFFGVIGFLIGMPIFYIILDLFKDLNNYIDKISKKHKEIRELGK